MWGKMQKHCVIAGCREENTSLHTLPREPKIKHEWLKFIYCQIPEKFSLNLTVCSAHFSADCFINLAQYSAGFAQKLRLKDGAVPTLVQPTTQAHDQSTEIVASPGGEMSGAENTVNEQDQSPTTCFNQNPYTIQQEEGDLIRKQLLNGGFKDYVCCVCGRCFAVLDELSDHFIIHKDKVRCHLCQTVFDQAVSLALHLENVHSKDLLFCRSCSITFTNVWHMNGHMGMHLQKQRTVDVHKETSPNQLTQEEFLCEIEEVIDQNKEEEVRNLKEEEQEVMIVRVKEEEEEVIIECKVGEMGAAKGFAENEQVEVKEEEEQEITENRGVDINNVKDEEVELGAVKTEVEENLPETSELNTMAWLHDHTYFSEQHLPHTDTTDTSSEVSEYLPTEFDELDASEDDQSVCESLHDHTYSSRQSLASPVVSTRKYSYNTRSSVQKLASDVTNANAKDLPLCNDKANTSLSSEDSGSEDDQQESPADGQRVCNAFRDHRYVPSVADPVVSEQVPAQTTCYTRKKTNYTINAYSDLNTESDEQPENPENEQLLASSLLDREEDQEEFEEYIVSVDHEDHHISSRDKSKKPPGYTEKHSLQFDSGGSQEGSRSLLKGRMGGNPALKQGCMCTKQKSVSCASDNLQVYTQCGLSKVPNLERHMEQCMLSFPCSLCRRTFGTKQLLMKHQADMHPLANYLCARCLQLFPNQDTFSKHICSTSNVLSRESWKPQMSSNSASAMFLDRIKQQANDQHGSSLTVFKFVKAPQRVNTASSLSNSPSVSDTQIVPDMAGRSLSCDQKQKVTVLNGNQRREAPISGGSQPKLGQVLTQTNFPKQKPTIGRHLPPPAPSQVSKSLSTPTQARILPQSNVSLVPTQIASSPQSPLKIVAMFVNQSQQLALEKRLCQSWRSKTAFQCRQCGAMSRQPSLGIRHRYQHRGPRQHRCQCGRAFQQRLHLLRHQVQHAEASRYVCATCGQTFRGTHQLGNHLPRALFKITPTDGKISTRKVCRNVFQCPCGQAFARPAALLWHMLKNSNARKSRLKKRPPVST